MPKNSQGDSKAAKKKTAPRANAEGGKATGYDKSILFPKILDLMAEGQSLRRICESVEGMPKHSTVMLWVSENSEYADQYTRARSAMTDYRFEEFRDHARVTVQKYLDEGWEPKDAIAMAKLECGNMQWELSKLAPKKYGDKLALAGDEDNPLKMAITISKEDAAL